MKHFRPIDILLPNDTVNYQKWSVIACDQHTSEGDYWHAVEDNVQNAPSTLSMILPEYYLGKNDSERIEAINQTMQCYLDSGIFKTLPNAYIYIERKLSSGMIRRGIVGALDLEAYDFKKNAKTPVRASEATVTERIPPRVRIRENAPLEAPHIMLLVDDFEKTVIEPLSKQKEAFTLLYDFDLMLGGGHITGYLVDDAAKAQIDQALDALEEKNPFLFAVGDGNHSLATAKTCYENAPSEASRYALCELVNIHDEALLFEPIYRVLFNADPKEVIHALCQALPVTDESRTHKITVYYGKTKETLTVGALSVLAVSDLQNTLDAYLKEHPTVVIDYIHGEEETLALAQGESTIAFLFDGMKKEDLFPAVAADGALVRKTFSMGDAADKRYYIECRRIK